MSSSTKTTKTFIKARIIPFSAALFRFISIVALSYLILFCLSCFMERFNLNNDNDHQTLDSRITSLRLNKEFDRNITEAATEIYLSSEEEEKQRAVIGLFTANPPSLQRVVVESPYQFKPRKNNEQESLVSITLDSNQWRIVKNSYTQILGLLIVSQIALVLFVGCVGFLRAISIYPKNHYIFRGFVFAFSVLPIFIIASLPDPFISIGARPGFALLEFFQINGYSGPEWFYGLWQIVFVVCFAGIGSQFAIDAVIKETPEENLNYYRGGSSAKWNAMRLSIARSSAKLEEWVPFFIIAVLFCRARLISASDNISVLVDRATQIQDPKMSLPALIMFIAVILVLTWIGRALFRFFQEALFPINLDSGVR